MFVITKNRAFYMSNFCFRYVPVQIPRASFNNLSVRAISAGGLHSGAITSDGRVFTWGSGKDGRLGHEEMQNMPAKASLSYRCTVPTEVKIITEKIKSSEIKEATKISCSHYHTVVLIDYPPEEEE